MPVGNYNPAFPCYERAQKSPESMALWVDGTAYSYAELAGGSGRVASWLRQRSRTRLKRVAILSGRSVGAYQGILGSCWAGASYVPLNPKFSEKRLAAIIQQAKSQALIVDVVGLELLSASLLKLLPPGSVLLTDGDSVERHGIKIDGLDRLEAMVPMETPALLGPDAEAYLVFTSGSTGDPSGVAISTANLAFAIKILLERYPFKPDDRFSQFFDLSFDFSVMDLFVPWQVGASTYVIPDRQKLSPGRFIVEHRLTVWTCVPSMITLMGRMGMLKPNIFPSLRFSCFSGETLTAEAAKVWQGCAPNGVIVNLYGQTEAPIGSLVQTYGLETPITKETGGLAIGVPLDGAYVAILDQGGRFAEGDGPGELALAGSHVARGYLDNPDRTAEKFKSLNHPQYGQLTWYLTGDLVRRDSNMTYHFLGRTDNEIKISGHRITLEGVEHCLRKCSGRTMVGVVPQSGNMGIVESLAGFVATEEIDEAEIKREMLAYLPKPLIPRRIFAIRELPLNANGKIDRQKLLKSQVLAMEEKQP